MYQKKNWMLRRVWTPAYPGLEAPLTAVWIETSLRTPPEGEGVAAVAIATGPWGPGRAAMTEMEVQP